MPDNIRTLDVDKLCSEVAEVLAGFDGESIERIANMVLVNPVKYVGDSQFTQELPE
jgi:hypothetical protein